MERPTKLSITPRDIDILVFAHLYDGVLIDQIRRRYWSSPGGRSPCYHRVQQLVQAGYLQASRLPSTSGLGSGPLFITIGPKAHTIVAEVLDTHQAEIRRQKADVTPFYAAHHNGISAVRMAVEDACQNASLLSLSDWITERELRANPIKVDDPKPSSNHHKSILLVADGLFDLTLANGKSQQYYLERDMGSLTNTKRVAAKLRGYLVHAWELKIPVLWVVPDQRRRQWLLRLAEAQAEAIGKSPRILWVATAESVTAQTVLFSPIWYKPGLSEPVALVPPETALPLAPASTLSGQLVFRGA